MSTGTYYVVSRGGRFEQMFANLFPRAGRCDTGNGASDSPTLSEVELGNGVELWEV